MEQDCTAVREKAEQLEALLKKAMDGPKSIGVIEAGPSDEGFYRISKQGSGSIVIPFTGKGELKVGDSVLVAGGFIESALPKNLFLEEKPPEFTHIGWDEIGGLRSQKARIKSAVEDPFTHADLYKEFNLSPIKGLMLSGPPGCGKTMIAKAIASSILKGAKIQAGAFVYIKGGEMLSPYVGQAEINIKAMFDSCREYFNKTGQRSVVFIDEAEAIVPERGSRQSSDVDSTIVPTFLAEMDGFSDNGPFVIMATNFPEQIDKAIRRPGRIDLNIKINRPTEEDAVDLFKIYLDKTKLSEDSIMMATEAAKNLFEKEGTKNKVSGAFISNIVSAATKVAIDRRIQKPNLKTGVILADLKECIHNC